MAIAHDSHADLGNNGGTTNSLTTAFNNVAGDLLFVGFAGDSVPGNDDVTGVTYNGVAMSLLRKSTDANQNRYSYVYYLAGPATGSHNVVISCTNNHFILALAVSYSGCGQTGIPDNQASTISSGAASSLQSTMTPVADNCWMVIFEDGYSATSTDPTAGSGATQRTQDAFAGVVGFFDNNGAIHPAAATSMTTARANNLSYIAHIVFTIAPPAAGGSAVVDPGHFLLTGVQ